MNSIYKEEEIKLGTNEINQKNTNNENNTFVSKIRRVNLCKKIVRKFKKYLKARKNEPCSEFWNKFCRENLLPPFKIDNIEFKSFSRRYLNWLFSHEGGLELYNEFIRNKGDEELNNMCSSYSIKNEENKYNLKNFFIKFAFFFANLKLDETQGAIENNPINEELNIENIFLKSEDCKDNPKDNISIGSISEQDIMTKKEKNRGRMDRNCNSLDKMAISDSSSSSIDNNQFDINIGHQTDIGKNYSGNNAVNNNEEGLYFNHNFQYNNNNKVLPDINFFDFNINNDINQQMQFNFFNTYDNENYFKKFSNNINED
jgi:hypothetical protein